MNDQNRFDNDINEELDALLNSDSSSIYESKQKRWSEMAWLNEPGYVKDNDDELSFLLDIALREL
jgi:hypothetical protein